MHKPQQQVLDFHNKFGAHAPKTFTPEEYPKELRVRLIQEELDEFKDALNEDDWAEVIDAVGDMLYVVYGAAVALGIDIEAAFDMIHKTNMLKEGGGTRADGKIKKPEGWEPPDIAGWLESTYDYRKES